MDWSAVFRAGRLKKKPEENRARSITLIGTIWGGSKSLQEPEGERKSFYARNKGLGGEKRRVEGVRGSNVKKQITRGRVRKITK